MNRLEACCCWQQPPKPASSRSWNRRCHLLPILSAFHGPPAQRCADAWYSPSCFWARFGLQRTWDLRGYTADGLALLTGRTHAYGYRSTEAFLSQVACADGAERFTNTLTCWTTHLWHPVETAAEAEHPHLLQALTCYLDGHRKPVYSDVLLPRGLVGRLDVVLGCRALLLLHDEKEHPLFVTTHRGDQHLTTSAPTFLERYEQQVQTSHIARMIVDREGMATEFLARLHAEGRIVVTILQTNQYRDLSSFSDVGAFEPLSTNTHGKVIREVALARITLPREEYPDDPLHFQVALIRDLRRKEPSGGSIWRVVSPASNSGPRARASARLRPAADRSGCVQFSQAAAKYCTRTCGRISAPWKSKAWPIMCGDSRSRSAKPSRMPS